jgi:hypothetical protein
MVRLLYASTAGWAAVSQWNSQDGGSMRTGEDYRCNRSSEWAANLRVFRAGTKLRVCRAATAVRA